MAICFYGVNDCYQMALKIDEELETPFLENLTHKVGSKSTKPTSAQVYENPAPKFFATDKGKSIAGNSTQCEIRELECYQRGDKDHFAHSFLSRI